MTLGADIDRVLARSDPATVTRAADAVRDGASTPAKDSIRAAIHPMGARNESGRVIVPVPISQLGDGDTVNWVWQGYLAREHVGLLTGLWKAGKTTLLSHLLRMFGSGGELAGAVHPCRVLVLSEESRSLWARRRDELAIGDHVDLILRPFLGRPRLQDWIDLLERVSVWVQGDGYGLVVFDTIASLWPVADENDAGQVLSALMPLHMLTKAGASVLLIHHPKKGDASEGQAARGSGALPGFVDVLVELRRYDASARDDRRRVLTAYSRFDETPSEVVLELGNDGYRTVGTRGDAKQSDRLAAIGELLPTEPPGMTVDELLAIWPETGVAKPGRRTAQVDLQHGERSGLWTVHGAGNKGDPHRYRRNNAIRAV